MYVCCLNLRSYANEGVLQITLLLLLRSKIFIILINDSSIQNTFSRLNGQSKLHFIQSYVTLTLDYLQTYHCYTNEKMPGLHLQQWKLDHFLQRLSEVHFRSEKPSWYPCMMCCYRQAYTSTLIVPAQNISKTA